MKTSVYFIAILFSSICMFLACGQDSIEWPPNSNSGGECGAYYPGATGADAGTGTDEVESPYGLEQGDIFPCAVWETVKLAGEDIYINVGEEHLRVKHGLSDRKALIVVVSAGS